MWLKGDNRLYFSILNANGHLLLQAVMHKLQSLLAIKAAGGIKELH